MGEKYTREQFEADLAARQEREAKEAQEAREKTEKESAKKAWLADGGNAGDFEKEWPTLRDQARRDRVLNADKRAREAMRLHGPSRI
jgi:hypothetical protein